MNRPEIIYFKFYKSQIPVIEQAIETASLMLGTDKSRGYCLEMICGDFLAGANLDSGNSKDDVQPRNPPQEVSEPLWRRLSAEPDYTLYLVSRQRTSRLSGCYLHRCRTFGA